MTKPRDELRIGNVSGYQVILARLSRFVALMACISAVAFPLTHVFDGLPKGSGYQVGSERIFVTADAFLQTVLFLSTLSFGMAAVAGFAVRNGIGTLIWKRELNILLLSFFTYFLSRSIIYAYDAHRAITVQLDSGNIYLNVLNPILEKQGTAVLYLAIISIAILAVNSLVDS